MKKRYRDLDLISFQRKFNTERKCRKRLEELRWPEGFKCPKCGHNHAYFLEKRMLFQCGSCRFQTSLTAGTIMHKTRTPLLKWFWAIYLVSTDKRGLSALALSRKIDVGLKCAWSMLHKIRKAMVDRDSSYQLAGLIQADDAFFKGGVKKGGDKRGRGTSKVPVVVMASVKDDAVTFARMEVIEKVDHNEINNVLAAHIAAGQTVCTDGFQAFSFMDEVGMVHERHVLYHKQKQTDHKILKWVNIVVSNAKAFILGTYHGVQKKHLQKYLNEFCYRFNRRFWPEQAFERLLAACVNAETVTFAELRQ